jgi:hypothetical protein
VTLPTLPLLRSRATSFAWYGAGSERQLARDREPVALRNARRVSFWNAISNCWSKRVWSKLPRSPTTASSRACRAKRPPFSANASERMSASAVISTRVLPEPGVAESLRHRPASGSWREIEGRVERALDRRVAPLGPRRVVLAGRVVAAPRAHHDARRASFTSIEWKRPSAARFGGA